MLIRKDGGWAQRIQDEFTALMARDWDVAELFRSGASSVFSGRPEEEGIGVPVIGAPSVEEPTEEAQFVILTSAKNTARGNADCLTESFYGEDSPVMPVDGPVTSDYGNRIHPITGLESFHSGRDISADEGTEIRAVFDGTVIATGVGELSGNYVKIDHGSGLVALYCHCSEVCCAEGDEIRKGDIIAAVGETGAATGPHLHFEVRRDGELIDPSAVLDQAVHVH